MIVPLHIVLLANPECNFRVFPLALNYHGDQSAAWSTHCSPGKGVSRVRRSIPAWMLNVSENGIAGGMKSSHGLGTGKGRSFRASKSAGPHRVP
jgi:hypothetical protein